MALGDIVVDPITGRLTNKAGQPVQLRNKSKAVLIYLLERPERTVAKTEILDDVWADVTVSDESLVQCIADIRRLVGADARQIIETVPREGYRLNLPTPHVSGARGRHPVAKIALVALGVALLGGVLAWNTVGTNGASETVAQEAPLLSPTEISPPGTSSTQAYLEVLQGRAAAGRYGHDESLVAERHFRTAISLDPNYARAHAELGTLLAVRFENDWTVLEDADKAKAMFYAERAAELEPDLWLAHYALGRLHSQLRDFETAEHHLEKAMSLQPENEDARAYYAVVQIFQGRAQTGIDILGPVIRSHPNPPFWYYFALGHASFNLGLYAEAETALTQCLELAGQSPYCLRYLIATYGAMGQDDKARDAGLTYASWGFDLEVEAMIDMVRFHHPDDLAHLREGLRQVGLPD